MWLPIMNWMVWANTYYYISHKVRHTQEYSIIKWRWYIWDQAPAVPESTSKLCEEVVQMVKVPILSHYFLSSACTDILLLSFLWPTDRGRENKDHFYRQFCTICRNTPKKWTVSAQQPLSEMFTKDGSKGKSSWWAELQAMYLFAHFAWKEKWPDGWL